METQNHHRLNKSRVRYAIGRVHWGLRRAVRDFVRYLLSDVLPPSVRLRLIEMRERRRRARYAKYFDLYRESGLDPVLAEIRESIQTPQERAKALIAVARNAMTTNVTDTERTVRALIAATDREDMLKWSTFAAWDSGNIRLAAELLERFQELEHETTDAAYKVRQIRGCYRLMENSPTVPPVRSAPAYSSDSRSMLYVASSSRPYHVTGYTSRTHHILRAIQASGWNVHCVTRPGYPFDRPDARQVTNEVAHEIDGVMYERLPGAHRREVDYDQYLWRSADVIEEAAMRLKPAVIQAASNYEAAFPAMVAAKRLGIPFVYEVRGLWEYTAASKKPGWEQTERFALDRQLEALVASHANHVFTLTTALADELVQRGVERDRISLAPNGIEPEAFSPIDRDSAAAVELGIADDAFVVGYVGSIVAYEGLDDLLGALRLLAPRHRHLRVIIVGDGDTRIPLQQKSREYGVADRVIFTGKVPPDAVSRYFSLFDAIALPRKPYQVCRLVSPLKPLEAMAMNVPMIVSDVEALAEMVEDGVSALVHKSGDPKSLATAIGALIIKPELGDKLAAGARLQMLPARTWLNIATELSAKLDRQIMPSGA